jgi:hypothetical protein
MLATAKGVRGAAASEAATSGERSVIASRLRDALGYHVEAAARHVGVLVGVPLAGRPPRPLVLVVRDGDCMRFLSVRRVRDVSSAERRVLLLPEDGGGRS